MTLADDIDSLLPQTQCQRCGYEGCRAYAEAVSAGEADINRCTPGGERTVERLAQVTGRPARPLAEDCQPAAVRRVAFIREDECIGCTRCIQACPVDAIIGAAKQMHTVLADQCTGCELCVPACPVDCIDMPPAAADTGQPHWPPASDIDRDRAAAAREHFQARQMRLNRQGRSGRKRRISRAESAQKRETIAEAMARARAKRAARQQ